MTATIRKNMMALLLLTSFIILFSIPTYADLGDSTLKKGNKSTDVTELQKKLFTLGYFSENNFTDYFGITTENAVKSFQKDYKLKPDGIAGKETLKLIILKCRQHEIAKLNSTTFKIGDSSEEIKDLKDKLKCLGLYNGEINEVFDNNTQAAVKAFQEKYGLKADGVADGATLVKLFSEVDNAVSANRGIIARNLVQYAKKHLGVPYVWGAASGKAFDCSGFTKYVMEKFGIDLARTASEQFVQGEKIEKADLLPGDLVFFTTYKKGPSHVGIYIGDNKFIHASSGSDRVTITDLNTNYYKNRYIGARRFNFK